MSELLIVVLLMIVIYSIPIFYIFGRPKYCWEKWGDGYMKYIRQFTERGKR